MSITMYQYIDILLIFFGFQFWFWFYLWFYFWIVIWTIVNIHLIKFSIVVARLCADRPFPCPWKRYQWLSFPNGYLWWRCCFIPGPSYSTFEPFSISRCWSQDSSVKRLAWLPPGGPPGYSSLKIISFRPIWPQNSPVIRGIISMIASFAHPREWNQRLSFSRYCGIL